MILGFSIERHSGNHWSSGYHRRHRHHLRRRRRRRH